MKHLLEAKGKSKCVKDNLGTTPLYISPVRTGHLPVIEHLLEAKADPNIPREDGATPLIVASYQGHNEVVQLLLKFGADPTLQTKSGIQHYSMQIQKEMTKLLHY